MLNGKINIVKTLGLSKLIYSASMLTVLEHLIQEIGKLSSISFGRGNHLKKKNGGLKMCDFKIMEKGLKIAWVNRNDSQASWKVIPSKLVPNMVTLPSNKVQLHNKYT